MRYIVLALVVALAGCATRPESVLATPQPAHLYKGLSCEELNAEQASVDKKLKDAMERQEAKSAADVANIALSFVLPFHFIGTMILGGNDSNVAVLSNLKGHADAVAKARADAKCYVIQGAKK